MSPVSGATATKDATAGQRPRPPQARRGSVGARLPRAAEQERGEQEERRRAERPPADHRRLLQARLRLDRPRRPARPVPLVRALHPAPPGHRRRQDRDPGAGGARRPVLHAARQDRRRPAVRRAAARHRRHLATSTPGAPPTSPTGRTSSCTGSRSRASRRSGSAWRRSAWPPPRPAATRRASSSAVRWPAWTPTRSSTPRRRSGRSTTRSSATRRSPTCRASSSPRSAGARRSAPHHEINDVAFVGVRHPRPARPATTCGSAAGCPPTR